MNAAMAPGGPGAGGCTHSIKTNHYGTNKDV